MRLNVKYSSGKTFTVEVESFDTINEVKKKIANNGNNLVQDHIILFFGGRINFESCVKYVNSSKLIR